jgi:hypothetical protein
LFELSLNIDVEYLYKNKIGCLSCDKIFDRPVELSGVERLASPLNLTLPILAQVSLTKIAILVMTKLA